MDDIEASSTLPCGTNVGEYTIKDRIWRGERTEVYHVEDADGESYALKIELEPGCSRLKSEIKVLLVCSGVPTFRDAGDVDGRAYIVQELLGPSLHTASMEHEGGIWPFMEVKRVACHLLEAIRGVHEGGYLHCALSPRAFYRRGQGADHPGMLWRLSGLGSAQLQSKRQCIPRADGAGPGAHTAPNLHNPLALPEERDDLISWLFIVAEMLTGRLPWKGSGDEPGCSEQAMLKLKMEAEADPKELFPSVGGMVMPRGFYALHETVVRGEPDDGPDYARIELLVDRLTEGPASAPREVRKQAPTPVLASDRGTPAGSPFPRLSAGRAPIYVNPRPVPGSSGPSQPGPSRGAPAARGVREAGVEPAPADSRQRADPGRATPDRDAAERGREPEPKRAARPAAWRRDEDGARVKRRRPSPEPLSRSRSRSPRQRPPTPVWDRPPADRDRPSADWDRAPPAGDRPPPPGRGDGAPAWGPAPAGDRAAWGGHGGPPPPDRDADRGWDAGHPAPVESRRPVQRSPAPGGPREDGGWTQRGGRRPAPYSPGVDSPGGLVDVQRGRPHAPEGMPPYDMGRYEHTGRPMHPAHAPPMPPMPPVPPPHFQSSPHGMQMVHPPPPPLPPPPTTWPSAVGASYDEKTHEKYKACLKYVHALRQGALSREAEEACDTLARLSPIDALSVICWTADEVATGVDMEAHPLVAEWLEELSAFAAGLARRCRQKAGALPGH
ncbi:hypothetical protein ACKKBF_B05370 [Auxenochlorella protothecoides x Auxenochlorella symbiontica]